MSSTIWHTYCTMKNVLRTLLLEWQERELPEVIPREINLKSATPKGKAPQKAVVVTGFRRVGKTYLLFEHIQKLLKRHSREEVIYLNFEDERLPTETQVLTQLLPEIQATFGQKPKYLFLDELQNIPDWAKWVRRILDTEDIRLFLTGLSSKMSSAELPTQLRGRSWEVRVHSLTFKEFLRFKNITLNAEKLPYLDEEKAKFNFWFEDYLLHGGMPEVVLVPEAKKLELLQSYFRTVVQQDIVERFSIRNEPALETTLKLLLNSTQMTVTKLYNSLKSLGVKVGKTTLNEYINHIKTSYFLEELYYWAPSIKDQLQYPRKVYFVDNGFITALSTKFSKNYGRLFENLVYWKLQQKHPQLNYYRDSKEREIDFVVMEDGCVKTLYQVCYDLSSMETLERETGNLLRAGKRFNCHDLRLIAKTDDEALKNLAEEKGITLIDQYQFFQTSG